MKMNVHLATESLHRGKILVATIPASSERYYAWIGIYPLDLSKPSAISFLKNHGIFFTGKSEHVYHIRKFEVEKVLVDNDRSIAEPHMQNKISYFAFGDEELFSKLKELNVEVDQLDLPHKSNYPI